MEANVFFQCFFTSELPMFQKAQTTGAKMLRYNQHDLFDLGIQDMKKAITILKLVSAAAKEPTPPRPGSVPWQEMSTLTRPLAKRDLQAIRGMYPFLYGVLNC